jgi:hypothetical protein
MVAAYIERSTVTGMAFTLLIFAFTIQNFFIFRNFWQRISVNNPNANADFGGSDFSFINYINFGNGLQTSYAFTSASFLDAVGAALAMYAGYTAVIGRVGFAEIFFLTWIGTFLYEFNSQILWRLYIPDNGYPSRAFAFGGALGIVSSLVINKRDKTINNPNYRSSYKIMALAFLGIIFVWCSYPVLVLSNVYESVTGKVVAMAGQVNIWLALAASVLGCYTASAFSYKKFCVHDMVFASITVPLCSPRVPLPSAPPPTSTTTRELQLPSATPWASSAPSPRPASNASSTRTEWLTPTACSSTSYCHPSSPPSSPPSSRASGKPQLPTQQFSTQL